MKLTATIRTQLGLTHEQIAGFIGADRSLLSRAEAGSRQLNGDALLHLLTLYLAYIKAPAREEAATIAAPLPAQLKEHAQRCRHKLYPLRQRLAAMQRRHAQCTRLLHCLQQLKTNNNLNSRQQRWLEIQQYEAGKKLAAADYGNQIQLQLSIQALEAEAAIYEAAATL